MKRGPPGLSVAEKRERGTFEPARDAGKIDVIAPSTLPQQPEWLTDAGKMVWLDNIGRVSSVRGASEIDSDLFGNFCNLQGAIAVAWRAGGPPPPTTALAEVRRMMELLRIAGPASRVAKVPNGDAPAANPFTAFRKGRG